ncbi:hypothetical protein A0O34_02730 [Chryseobacterium glaciei]|uniref:Uncharacterized protein n=1 Tax=Chryseobacterium glaciei TaxID=1685010 RepID=A0A172XRR9_9FLAO|nr:hypothetical protein [Chryseobacterium glaciei]ANF49532.1 hypothetical protein A0O34_02730 [Chryseobacterium glaciei]
MEKENIITINQTHQEAEFNWAIKRYLPNFKDGKPTIIGMQFPWKRIFDDEKSLEETLQTIVNLFNDFTRGDFFKSINYTPQYRDIFLLKASLISSYYWIEFIFTKDKWNLKTKGYSWEQESFIFSLGNNLNNDFIVSKIGYEVLFYSYRNPDTDEDGFRKRKYKLPIYINDEDFLNSDYIFLFEKSDGLRGDLRVRSINLLIDNEFDYYLHIRSNELSDVSGKNLDFVHQGQIPKNILFQLLKVIQENENYRYYGGGAILDLPQTHFIFKIKDKIYRSGILSNTNEKDYHFKNLEDLKSIILDWVEIVINFQKQN